MRRLLIGCFLVVYPLTGLAQHIAMPEFYDVDESAYRATLNIYAEPSVRSEVLASLAQGIKKIEVVAIENDWAKINLNEGSGWVPLRYLKMQDSVWKNGQLPDTLSCFGVEPFWTVTFTQNEARLQTPDQATQRFSIESIADRGFSEDRLRAIQAGDLSLVMVPKNCSDGMSDKQYALEAVVMLRSSQNQMLSGCCTIATSKLIMD